MSTKQITVYGTTEAKIAFGGPNSKGAYTCANSSVTRGITAAPSTYQECFEKFPSVKKIAQGLGFITGSCAGSCGGACGPTKYEFALATQEASTPSQSIEEFFRPLDIYFEDPTSECTNIVGSLGESWLGCLWGTPSTPFSCTCPDIGSNFANYLRLRLNVATFWNTPKNAPVKRAEFLDAIKYGPKATITVPGDFNLKIGQVVELSLNGISGFPYSSTPSILNGYYYIVGIKHVVTNSGTHETALTITQIPT